jgi:hypothetical protein
MSAQSTSPATAPAVMDAPEGVSQAAIFAREHAKGAARGMLAALDQISANSVKITKIALGVSMPHQIGFLLSLVIPHVSFANPVDIVHTIGMLMLVLGAPVIADLLIVNCIKTVSQPAASDSSKKAALWIMSLPVIASAGVNALAYAPHWVLRVLAVFIVVAIPMAEILRILVRPDFGKIEQMELAVEAQLTRKIEDAIPTVTVAEPEPVDYKALNRQRQQAAERARDLALKANGEITAAALQRATNCGSTAARKAIAAAKAAAAEAVAV